ncbi:MAG: cupin domain-containing protein [Cyanobacteria bacterium P01_H01_bin.121]
MPTITIQNNPDPAQLTELGVKSWPIWTKEVSQFPWHYTEQETCYLLAGAVEVTPEIGEAVTFGVGDLVVFPAGLSCTWDIKQPVRKHYKFG